jgi:Ribbon-helix-helix protein, copG family
MPSMRKTTLYLDEETDLSLKQLARAQGRSQAEVVREALAIYAAGAERPRPVGIGAYRSGRSDVSASAERLLRAAARRSRSGAGKR